MILRARPQRRLIQHTPTHLLVHVQRRRILRQHRIRHARIIPRRLRQPHRDDGAAQVVFWPVQRHIRRSIQKRRILIRQRRITRRSKALRGIADHRCIVVQRSQPDSIPTLRIRNHVRRVESLQRRGARRHRRLAAQPHAHRFVIPRGRIGTRFRRLKSVALQRRRTDAIAPRRIERRPIRALAGLTQPLIAKQFANRIACMLAQKPRRLLRCHRRHRLRQQRILHPTGQRMVAQVARHRRDRAHLNRVEGRLHLA